MYVETAEDMRIYWDGCIVAINGNPSRIDGFQSDGYEDDDGNWVDENPLNVDYTYLLNGHGHNN